MSQPPTQIDLVSSDEDQPAEDTRPVSNNSFPDVNGSGRMPGPQVVVDAVLVDWPALQRAADAIAAPNPPSGVPNTVVVSEEREQRAVTWRACMAADEEEEARHEVLEEERDTGTIAVVASEADTDSESDTDSGDDEPASPKQTRLALKRECEAERDALDNDYKPGHGMETHEMADHDPNDKRKCRKLIKGPKRAPSPPHGPWDRPFDENFCPRKMWAELQRVSKQRNELRYKGQSRKEKNGEEYSEEELFSHDEDAPDLMVDGDAEDNGEAGSVYASNDSDNGLNHSDSDDSSLDDAEEEIKQSRRDNIDDPDYNPSDENDDDSDDEPLMCSSPEDSGDDADDDSDTDSV